MVDSRIATLILDAAARRWTRSPGRHNLIFRGSFVLGLWIGRGRRAAQDLDFLAMYPFDRERVHREMQLALSEDLNDGIWFDSEGIESEVIFAETEFPGVRLNVPVVSERGHDSLQIDVAFGDPVPFGSVETPVETANETTTILAPVPEVGFAWKLHGLVEFEGLAWRSKDLADLWLLIRHAELDEKKLDEAIRVAFESRDGPLWRLDRLFDGKLGGSARSQRGWRKLRAAQPEMGLPEMLESVVTDVANQIAHLVARRRSDPTAYPASPTVTEMQTATNHGSFRAYTWDVEGQTFVYERVTKDTFPPPHHAATKTEFRQRQLRAEARGITFDNTGTLLARPFPRFERLELPLSVEQQSQLCGAEAFEKLDGSLVFPTLTANGVRWRTRRGVSEIGDQAAEFAEQNDADYRGLVQDCLARELTPLFEWCSRKRPIVLDHPQDRLVLTAIRENHSGHFLPRSQVEELAARYQTELVCSLGTVADPQNWIAEVDSWKDREGCVLRTSCDRHFKIKSTRYRLLHQSVEGPHRDHARWRLLLSDGAEALFETNRLRGIDLREYANQLETALVAGIARFRDEVAPFKTGEDSARRELALHVRDRPPMERRVCFYAFEHEDFGSRFRAYASDCCFTRDTFHQFAALISGPKWNDG